MDWLPRLSVLPSVYPFKRQTATSVPVVAGDGLCFRQAGLLLISWDTMVAEGVFNLCKRLAAPSLVAATATFQKCCFLKKLVAVKNVWP